MGRKVVLPVRMVFHQFHVRNSSRSAAQSTAFMSSIEDVWMVDIVAAQYSSLYFIQCSDGFDHVMAYSGLLNWPEIHSRSI